MVFEGVRWSASDDRQESFFCGKRKNESPCNYSSAERSHYSLPNSSSRLRFLPPFIPRNRLTLISPLSLSPAPVGGNQPQRTGNRSNPLVHPTRQDKRRKCLLTRGAVESVSHLSLSVVGGRGRLTGRNSCCARHSDGSDTSRQIKD